MRDSGVLLALVRFLEGSEIFRGSINFFSNFFTKIGFFTPLGISNCQSQSTFEILGPSPKS